MGDAGAYFVGPVEERWDVALMVRQASVQDFFSFATNDGYLAGIGHRIAAVDDSRILPVAPRELPRS